MRPNDLEHELERLSAQAATSRLRMREMREQLGRARSIIDEIRRVLGGEENRRQATNSTPGDGRAQGEAV